MVTTLKDTGTSKPGPVRKEGRRQSFCMQMKSLAEEQTALRSDGGNSTEVPSPK